MAETLPPSAAERLAQTAALVSTSVAALLTVIKAYGWWVTGSVAMLSSLVDSALDAGMSILILIAVWKSAQPADREHRYGHGKAEAVAAVVQAAFIAVSGGLILIECARRLLTPDPVREEALGIVLILVTMAMNIGLVAYQSWVVRRTSSVAIEADRAHYASDLLIGAGVLISFVLAGGYDVLWVDPIVAAIISGALLLNAYRVGKRAMDLLMDRELPDAERDRVRNVALEHPGVKGVRDLRTRSAGTDVFVQMILLVDGAQSVRQAHRIVDEVERRIYDLFPNAEVLIHEEPEDLPEERSTAMRPGSRHDDVAD